MVQLDNKRKVALVVIVLAFVFCGFIGQVKSPQVQVAAAPAAVVESETKPTATAEVTQTTTPTAVAEVKAEQPQPKADQPPAEAADPTSISDIVQSLKQPVKEEAVAPIEQAAAGSTDSKSFSKFVIYQDNPNKNHYVLSGLMPDGKCVTFNNSWKENCQEGNQCLQINYDAACSAQDQGWAGAYWLSPANNWGDHKGGYDLTGAQRIVFWARGEKGGEVIDSFRVGGVGGDEHPFPDTDAANLGPITLTSEWKEYSIDLKGKNLSHIVGGFSWSANAEANPEGITFYLDNIYFE